jgi:hypothetical protein
MKCHIPAKHIVTHSQAKVLNEYLDGLKEQTMRRIFKIMCVALHDEQFGFGHDRLAKLIGKISEISAESEHDEIYWNHIDRVVINELKLDFEREDV